MAVKISAVVTCDICGKDGAIASTTSDPAKHLAQALVTAALNDLRDNGWVRGRYQCGQKPVDLCYSCRAVAPSFAPCDNDGDDIEDLTP